MSIIGAILLLLFATVPAEFHTPSAEWSETDSATLAVELAVGLTGSDGPVAVHLALPGETERVVPMTARVGGRWEAAVEVRKADWRVVFEDLSSGYLTPPEPLSRLGARPLLESVSTSAVVDEPTVVPSTAVMLTVAAVLVATGLAAVAGRRRLAPRHRAVRLRRRRRPPRRRRSAPS